MNDPVVDGDTDGAVREYPEDDERIAQLDEKNSCVTTSCEVVAVLQFKSI